MGNFLLYRSHHIPELLFNSKRKLHKNFIMSIQHKFKKSNHSECRHVVIYGYTKKELEPIIRHFEERLPDYIALNVKYDHKVTGITLHGEYDRVEMLRFTLNKLQHNLCEIFHEEVLATENLTIPEILGSKLLENELTVSCAESCTGGNIAHKIVQIPGSSAYFLGSVVSYSNDVKASVLGVQRNDIDRFGAVSREVVEAMVKGACKLMHTSCGIATSGIAGPEGGSKLKPVGTVWIAAKCLDTVVSECHHFPGNRNQVIEAATNHGMVMLINLLRNNYVMQEDISDE